MNITPSFDNEKEKLAARCEMGDIAAMMELSRLFMHKTTEICRNMAKDYGRGEKQKNVFLNYLKEHPEELNNVQAANMWVTRAAFYGHR
ncbi:MAG: hypothetical protein LIO44_07060 [Eubacterium sp.]|nr:hypothetical protein [Eubacterium sp.]